ncbi:unnamed protein product [Vicia faba]|uniref:Uncharacterized protein n=1 Tax=Vicia faba TaxID=3906 RepID=A0AAV1AUH1_VICFA|nr:unnamed protein product [Vicia faba]
METSRKRATHQHHRSSSPTFEQQREHALKGNMSMFSETKCCYYLLETVPLPGPTWSSSEPSVLADPPPSSSSSSFIEASVGSEMGENNQGSLYTWWIGFLEGLDGKKTIEKNEVVMEHSKGATSFESKFVDAIDVGCCDDWLIVPTMEMDLGEIVVVP